MTTDIRTLDLYPRLHRKFGRRAAAALARAYGGRIEQPADLRALLRRKGFDAAASDLERVRGLGPGTSRPILRWAFPERRDSLAAGADQAARS